MSSHPSLDPESFEAFLANAFEVQQSGLDPQSLSALLEIQRFMATPEFNADRTLHLIADRALKVSHASGIAIALLESNQLIYRAGSGSAAIQIGRHVPAVLCARNEVEAEILRVENAQNDSRVQADICKQFGATSLLILPIYEKRVIAGVLQVHFSEAHVFLDREVQAYRLMAALAEEAISRNLQRSTKEAPAAQSVPAIESKSAAQRVSNEDDERPIQAEPALSQPHIPLATMEWATFRLKLARQFGQKVNRLFANNVWPLAATVTAVPLLAVAILIAHHHDHVPYNVSSTNAMRPNTTSPNVSPSPASVNEEASNAGTKRAMPTISAFRRVQIGPNEVDYISEDVTIRHFTNRPAGPRTGITDRQVDLGEDVTIRYFSNKPRLDSQTAPVPPASQTANQSLSR